MPSSSSFNPKPTPLRMDASLSSLYHLDYVTLEAKLGRHDRPTFSLGGHRFSFHEGQWVVEWDDWGRSSKVTCQDRLERLRRRNQRLKQQCNLLKLQVDVLMDMVVDMQAAAQLHHLSLERSGQSGRAPSPPQQKESFYEKVDDVLWD